MRYKVSIPLFNILVFQNVTISTFQRVVLTSHVKFYNHSSSEFADKNEFWHVHGNWKLLYFSQFLDVKDLFVKDNVIYSFVPHSLINPAFSASIHPIRHVHDRFRSLNPSFFWIWCLLTDHEGTSSMLLPKKPIRIFAVLLCNFLIDPWTNCCCWTNGNQVVETYLLFHLRSVS